MKVRVVAIAVTVAALLSVGIAWLWGTPPLARLSFREGKVERDLRGAEGRWQDAEVGASLAIGDGLRTLTNARARLSLSRGTVLQIDPETTLRLLAAAPGQEGFRIEKGTTQIEAGEAELSIETSAGVVRVARKSRARVRESAGETWVRVDMGKAELGWSQASTLAAGEEHSANHAETALVAAAAQGAARTPPTPNSAADDSAPAQPEAGVAALVRGRDVRVQREGEAALSPIVAGEHRLPVGTRVSVQADSEFELAQGAGGKLVTSGRAELVVGDGEQVATRVLSGKLRATAGRVPVELEVPGGRIVLMVDENGVGSALLRVAKDETEVQVERGSAALSGEAGEETIQAGARGHLGASAKSERDSEPKADAAANVSTSPDADAPTSIDLALPAGGSLQVHDPAPPTALSFTLGDKCGGGEAFLEVATKAGGYVQRASGSDQLRAWFPAGSTAYRVRCQRGRSANIAATGRVFVQRDQAERQVTRRAPEIDLELDGRKYTAVYQTLLPRVNVQLPAGKVTLRVLSGGSARELPGLSGRYSFESGALKEGEHSLNVQPGGTKPTTLFIRFDNAAPAAYVESAAGLTRQADGSYLLRGGALPGSEVSVDGKRLTLDKESRFETTLKLAPGRRGFGLWIKHPRAGSHYYVRRVQGGAP